MLTAVLWLLVLGVVAFIYYARQVEPMRVRLTSLRVQVADLPEALEGLRVLHMSDLHVDENPDGFAARAARRAVTLGEGLGAELVCLTGDLGETSRSVAVAAEMLRPLSGPPMYVVMGNHDHDRMLETDVGLRRYQRLPTSEWRRVMSGIGAVVLENELAVARVRGCEVIVAGAGDPSCGYDDLARTLAGDPNGGVHLLLAHSPDIIDDPRSEWADLVLCGHTHGGQITLPGIGSPWAPVWHDRRRAAGLMRFGRTAMSVTRGVAAGTRMRFLCPPEVALITLTRGPGDPARPMTRRDQAPAMTEGR